MEQELHEFQASILKELLFNPRARFRDLLATTGVTSDHFTFHLKRLIEEGLVVKDKLNYHLTIKGKEYANRMDTESLHLERQAKVAVAIHASRMGKNGMEILIHHRLKEPFFGWYGSFSGKIRGGETPLEAARREFKEESNMSGEMVLKAIAHYHDFYKDGKLLEDKYFWVFWVENPTGELKQKVEGGENIWMTEKEFRELKHVFASYDVMMEEFKNKTVTYVERKQVVEEY